MAPLPLTALAALAVVLLSACSSPPPAPARTQGVRKVEAQLRGVT